MVKRFAAVMILLGMCSCARTPGEVMQKVKYDFGIGEKPEGYVTGTEKVMENLQKVGQSELKRMNMEGRHGEVEFQQESQFKGSYFKRVKVYEDFYPLDARSVSRSAQGERGYVGYIEYSYRIRESERMSNRTEASRASATIETTETGRETYRYAFSTSGSWDGREGELTRR